MPHDEPPTIVVFRRWRDGGIIALFPEIPATNSYYDMLSYEHVGQHGAARDIVSETTLATPKQYADLKRELEGRGYKLVVRRRIRYAMMQKREAALKEINRRLTDGRNEAA